MALMWYTANYHFACSQNRLVCRIDSRLHILRIKTSTVRWKRWVAVVLKGDTHIVVPKIESSRTEKSKQIKHPTIERILIKDTPSTHKCKLRDLLGGGQLAVQIGHKLTLIGHSHLCCYRAGCFNCDAKWFPKSPSLSWIHEHNTIIVFIRMLRS